MFGYLLLCLDLRVLFVCAVLLLFRLCFSLCMAATCCDHDVFTLSGAVVKSHLDPKHLNCQGPIKVYSPRCIDPEGPDASTAWELHAKASTTLGFKLRFQGLGV